MSNETVLLAKHNIFTLALMVSNQKIFLFLKLYPKAEMGSFEIGAVFWGLSHRGNQAFWMRTSRLVLPTLTYVFGEPGTLFLS